jgi:hypothetical protein
MYIHWINDFLFFGEGANFLDFVKYILDKRIFCCKFLVFFKEKKGQRMKEIRKLAKISYNIKAWLRFSTFIFWISPNLAKYIYGWLPIEQYHKIELLLLLLLLLICSN